MSEERRVDDIQGEIIHVYDGIEEADNQLPLWWLITFYGSIAFAVAYWFHYQVFQTGMSSMEAYQAAVAANAPPPGAAMTDEALVALSGDPSAVAAGQATFAASCVACHAEQGQGNVGPNLTDAYWIHGGAPTDILQVITEGVGDKGMPAWGPILGPDSVQKVAAYVLSIRDTNVAGKEPQGEPYPPGGETGAALDTAQPTEAPPPEAAAPEGSEVPAAAAEGVAEGAPAAPE